MTVQWITQQQFDAFAQRQSLKFVPLPGPEVPCKALVKEDGAPVAAPPDVHVRAGLFPRLGAVVMDNSAAEGTLDLFLAVDFLHIGPPVQYKVVELDGHAE